MTQTIPNVRRFIDYSITNSTAEVRFKNCVINLIADGVYPGPQAINERLHGYRSKSINGRECQWRREICAKIGFRLHGRNLDDSD
jgi:hypothetical protein